MNGTSKSPSRDGPRGGSSEGTDDTEGRHFSGSDADGRRKDVLANCARSRGDKCTWFCLATACDPNTRLQFFPGDIKVPRVESPFQRSQLALHNYEIPRILQHTRYPARCKTYNPNQIDPPKMQSIIGPAMSGAGYVPVKICNGCDSRSDDSHVR